MQRFAKFFDVTEDLFACLKGASGVPEVVPVSIDPGENAVCSSSSSSLTWPKSYIVRSYCWFAWVC
jgi:hypothetical protein